ncbi:MAG: disulfide bond formation protein B [Alphaproteobacteria bacterium]|nr:disulfide bond formation protein B [Alphaproteobacteria bacterium]
MNKIISIVKTCSCAPARVLMLSAAISILALAAAFASEAFLGLEPCKLCIYQRWPYVLAAGIAFAGLIARGKYPQLPAHALLLSAPVYLLNAGIAFYHSGVERHWWKSAIDGCVIPGFGKTEQSFLENILSAPAGRCDEIPWADPLLGLSMANYNIALCLALFALCVFGRLSCSRD